MSDQLNVSQSGKLKRTVSQKQLPWELTPRELLWSRWLGFAVLTFFFLIPLCHTVFGEIPPLEELQFATGIFSYKKQVVDNNPGEVIILNHDEDHYYSCRSTIAAPSRCFYGAVTSKRRLDSFVGKTADIWWYEQNLYLLYTQRRLVRLVVEGREEYSYENAVEESNGQKKFQFYITIFVVVFLGYIQFKFERAAKRLTQTKEGSEHE